jgi:hypothetical protein
MAHYDLRHNGFLFSRPFFNLETVTAKSTLMVLLFPIFCFRNETKLKTKNKIEMLESRRQPTPMYRAVL